MGWILYAAVVLVVSGAIGLHLGRFREVYTEMLGMMVGMTMGMLNGFVLGYAAAAFTNSMVWGNLFGILLGLALGVYFGRPGGLMGLLDGGMGGVMGGSMGAMLAIMVRFPPEGLIWTAVLLAAVYILGMLSLVVLVERSAPGHAALHRLAPWFARAVALEIAEAQAEQDAANTALVNYYEVLEVPVKATNAQIAAAYMTYVRTADATGQALAEEALTTLSNPQTRTHYDRALAVASGRDACCPPPRRTAVATAASPPAQTPVRREVEPVVAPAAASTSAAAPTAKRLVDYYAFLGVRRTATEDEITDAYLTLIDGADAATAERAERAISILMDSVQRAEYDRNLAASRAPANGAGASGPPRAVALAAPVSTAPVLVAATPDGQGNGAPGPAAGAPSGQSAGPRPSPNGAPASAASGPRGNDKQAPPGRPPSGNGAGGASAGRSGAGTGPVRPARPPVAAPVQGGRAAGGQNTTRRRASYQQPARQGGVSNRWLLGALPGVALLIGIVVVALLLGNHASSGPAGGASASAPDARLAAPAVAVPVVNGVQTQDVLLNGDTFQYEPKVITVKQGIPVRFNLSVKGEPG